MSFPSVGVRPLTECRALSIARTRHLARIAVGLVCLSCADTRSDTSSTSGGVRGSTPHVIVRPSQPGIPFDPSTLRPGQRIGDLVVDSVSAQRTIIDSTWVGYATFRGELALTGRMFPHPDADLRKTTTCFEADSASAARLPRWAADERRPWFCFDNRAEAERAIQKAGVDSVLTIQIDRFTIQRNLSDAVNAASFVRVVRADSGPR